jgi:hypothetical protein
MKTTLLLLIFSLFLSLSVLAKPSEKVLKKTQSIHKELLECKKNITANNSLHFNNEATIVTLDSIIDTNGKRTYITYEKNGWPTLIEKMAYSEWDESSYYEEKIVYQYDNKGNPTLYEHYSSDYQGGIVIDEKEESVWNDKNQPLSIISWNKDEDTGEFLPLSKSTYEYSGNTAVASVYEYNIENESYILTGKYNYVFRNDNQVERADIFTIDEETGELFQYAIMELEYNSKNLETRSVMKVINEETGEYVDFLIVEANYDDNNNVIHTKDYMLNEGEEFLLSEQTMKYNSAGQIIEENTFGADLFSGEVSLIEQSRYNYNNSILSEKIDAMTDYETGGLIDMYKHIFTFSKDINSLSIARPEVDVDYCEATFFQYGRIDKIAEYELSDNNQLEKASEKTFYYSSATEPETSSESMFSQVKVFPNPFIDVLTIDLVSDEKQSVRISDISGKVVYETEISGKTILRPEISKRGIYLIEVVGKSTSFRTSLMRK